MQCYYLDYLQIGKFYSYKYADGPNRCAHLSIAIILHPVSSCRLLLTLLLLLLLLGSLAPIWRIHRSFTLVNLTSLLPRTLITALTTCLRAAFLSWRIVLSLLHLCIVLTSRPLGSTLRSLHIPLGTGFLGAVVWAWSFVLAPRILSVLLLGRWPTLRLLTLILSASLLATTLLATTLRLLFSLLLLLLLLLLRLWRLLLLSSPAYTCT
jgi:hypothetical protein